MTTSAAPAQQSPSRFSLLTPDQRRGFWTFAVGTALVLAYVVGAAAVLATAFGEWGSWLNTFVTVAFATGAVMLIVATTYLQPLLIFGIALAGFFIAARFAHAPDQTPATIAEIAVFSLMAGVIASDEQQVLGKIAKASTSLPRSYALGGLVILHLLQVPGAASLLTRLSPTPVAQVAYAGADTGGGTASAQVGGRRRIRRGHGADADADADAVDVSKLVTNLTAQARAGKLPAVVGRDAEIAEVEEILGQLKPANAALVAVPGSGKTAIVVGLTRRWAVSHPDRTVYSVDAGAVKASGSGLLGDLPRAWLPIIALASDPNTYLFIDEAHTALANPDVSNLLKPALADGRLRVIAASTLKEWERDVDSDEALARRFSIVRLSPMSAADAVPAIRYNADLAAKHNQVRISDDAVETVAQLAKQHITDRALPGSAVALINRSASRAQQQGLAEVTPELVAEVLASQTGVPVAAIAGDGQQRLARLSENLRAGVFGQDEVLSAVVRGVKAKELGISDPNRPASFIFLGPTGVGKTETVKVLAEYLAPGSDTALVTIEGGKYQEAHRVSELLGAPAGYQDSDKGGLLTNAIRRGARIVLFDEIEKMHPDILKILLSILDTGALTDGVGDQVSFRNTTVVLTSNLGARGAASTREEMERAARDHFPPELWGRIAHKLYYQPLSRDGAGQIADKLIGQLAARMNEKRQLTLATSDELRDKIVSVGYSPDDGARSLRPVILSIESALGDALIAGQLHNGDAVRAIAVDDREDHGRCVLAADGLSFLLGTYVEKL